MPAARQSIDHRLPALALAAVAALLVPLVALATPSPARAATHAVDVLDGSFSPATLTINVGDTVTWTNADDSPHTVTAGSGGFDSGTMEAGATFSFTFEEAGTFAYVCAFHDEMLATVIVQPASAPAAPAAPAATQAPAGGAAGGAPAGSHAPGHIGGTGEQPDTALPLPASVGWLAPLLIGLGLVAFAFGLVPIGRPAPAQTARRDAGWRR
jgi:plastocyanin